MTETDNQHKISVVKTRSQTFNPKTGLWVKKNTETGVLVDNNNSESKFKGVRQESLNKISTTLNKLARYDKGI